MPEGGVGSVFKKDDDVVNREALFNLTSGMDFVFTKMMQAVSYLVLLHSQSHQKHEASKPQLLTP